MGIRSKFFAAVIGVALIVFLAQSLEYRGADYMEAAAYVALGGGLGTIAVLILSVYLFKEAGTKGVLLATSVFAALPFVVEWGLSTLGMQLNVHGFAFVGYVIYAFGSWLGAIGLLIATAVRVISRLRQAG